MILLHCARVPAALPATSIAAILDRLPRVRAEAMRRRYASARILESVTGFALLAAAGRTLALPPLAALRFTRQGKPHWKGGPAFSISHAGGFAACAILPADTAIGLDLEEQGRVRAESLRRVTNEDERARLAAGTVDATTLWTCKEAVLKAAGLRLADARRIAIEGDTGRAAGRRFHLGLLRLEPGLCVAIATVDRWPAPLPRWFTTGELFGARAAERRRA